MKLQYPDLVPLGWNEWFEERAAECGPGNTIARVVAVDRDLLLVMDPAGTFRAKTAGSYLFRHHLVQELPSVGDWVCVEKDPAGDLGRVCAVLERKSTLRRRAAGDVVDYQMIAANVDCVIVVQSCHFDFNVNRLERYLVMVKDGGAEPGCAVLEAVNSGAISRAHYDNYIKLRQESAFYQMSYVEKRKKDRNFGKYVKSVKKQLKK
ncbi:MAG: hypothetical protein SWC96_04595 [Thermodesulfobacteriota bacterium]|nr:hypothetical protein [Thermodesulfobacteriota bacterium]